MSTTMVPDIRTAALADVEEGSLVQYDERLAIALHVIDKHRVLAIFSAADTVLYRTIASDTDVLDLGSDLVLELMDLDERTQFEVPHYESGTRLFIFDDGPRLVVKGEQFNDWHFVNLKTGTMAKREGTQRPAFTKWRLGIKHPYKKPVWMVKAPAPPQQTP